MNSHNSMTKDAHFMRLALQQANMAAKADEVPVGAVVVYGDEVIAQAHNEQISAKNPSAHAEILALQRAAEYTENYRLPDCSLYVTLEPCVMCAGAMIHARIARLVYAASDPKTGVVETVDHLFDRPYHNHQVAYQGGVLASECGQLLQQFFRTKRAIKKSRN